MNRDVDPSLFAVRLCWNICHVLWCGVLSIYPLFLIDITSYNAYDGLVLYDQCGANLVVEGFASFTVHLIYGYLASISRYRHQSVTILLSSGNIR